MYNFKSEADFINDNRNNEINRFWSRGSYFWVFIAASYTAYFSLYKFFNSTVSDTPHFTFLADMPIYCKIILASLSFIGFFFCLSWFLVNKGSKFWQTNWENELCDTLYYGKIYKNYANNMSGEDASALNPIKPYDFSVSKITIFGSFILTIFSLFFFVFNIMYLFSFYENLIRNHKIFLFLSMLIYISIITTILCFSFVGNINKDDKKGILILQHINFLIWSLIEFSVIYFVTHK